MPWVDSLQSVLYLSLSDQTKAQISCVTKHKLKLPALIASFKSWKSHPMNEKPILPLPAILEGAGKGRLVLLGECLKDPSFLLIIGNFYKRLLLLSTILHWQKCQVIQMILRPFVLPIFSPLNLNQNLPLWIDSHLKISFAMAQRWRWVQHVAEEFWRRWRSEYVQSLQTRLNWKTNQASPTEGDIVLIKDKQNPRNSWPISKITSLKLSNDGKVRSVILKLPPLPGKPSRSTTR